MPEGGRGLVGSNPTEGSRKHFLQFLIFKKLYKAVSRRRVRHGGEARRAERWACGRVDAAAGAQRSNEVEAPEVAGGEREPK